LIPCQSKGFWITLAISTALLLITANHYFRVMTSAFKEDMGNGVVIYADEYVKTGNWVFNCRNSRLISRTPLSTPLAELESTKKLSIGDMFYLKNSDKQPALNALTATIETRDWYKNLRYLYSALDEDSNLNSHMFYLITQHAGRSWAVEVDQLIDYSGKSRFEVYATPYDAETYVDHAKALQIAAKSCPAPQ